MKVVPGVKAWGFDSSTLFGRLPERLKGPDC